MRDLMGEVGKTLQKQYHALSKAMNKNEKRECEKFSFPKTSKSIISDYTILQYWWSKNQKTILFF